jgi:hypothetical protein
MTQYYSMKALKLKPIPEIVYYVIKGLAMKDRIEDMVHIYNEARKTYKLKPKLTTFHTMAVTFSRKVQLTT